MITDVTSKLRTVTSGVTQGLIPSLVLFNIFINNLNNWQCTHSKSAEDTKLEGGDNTPEGHAFIQSDLGSLEKRTDKNLLKFDKEKC